MLNDTQKYIIKSYFETDIFEAIINSANPRFGLNQILSIDINQQACADLTQFGIEAEVELAWRFLNSENNPETLLNLNVRDRAAPGNPATATEVKAYIRELVNERLRNLPNFAPAPNEAQPTPSNPPLPPETLLAQMTVSTNTLHPNELENLVSFLSKVFLVKSVTLDADSTRWLLYALKSDQPQERREIALLAVRYCTEISNQLRQGITYVLFKDSDDRVRSRAAEALAYVRSLTDIERDHLYNRFHHDEYLTVRIACAETLYRQGDRDPKLLNSVLEYLTFPGLGKPHREGAELVRIRAAQALAIFDDRSPRVERALRDAANEDAFANVKIAANVARVKLNVNRDLAIRSLYNLRQGRFEATTAEEAIKSLYPENEDIIKIGYASRIDSLIAQNNELQGQIRRLTDEILSLRQQGAPRSGAAFFSSQQQPTQPQWQQSPQQPPAAHQDSSSTCSLI